MNDFRGKTMTANLTANGYRFSEEVIKDILEKQPKLIVSHNFQGDPIGHTTGFTEYGDNSISVDIHLDKMDALRYALLPLFIVPTTVVNEEDIKEIDGVKTITKARFISFSLTNSAADPNLTPIVPIKK